MRDIQKEIQENLDVIENRYDVKILLADNKQSKIGEELADVIMYYLSLAEVTGLEIGEIVLKKIALNNAE